VAQRVAHHDSRDDAGHSHHFFLHRPLMTCVDSGRLRWR
jgi:hypothetical protein